MYFNRKIQDLARSDTLYLSKYYVSRKSLDTEKRMQKENNKDIPGFKKLLVSNLGVITFSFWIGWEHFKVIKMEKKNQFSLGTTALEHNSSNENFFQWCLTIPWSMCTWIFHYLGVCVDGSGSMGFSRASKRWKKGHFSRINFLLNSQRNAAKKWQQQTFCLFLLLLAFPKFFSV